MWGKKSGMAVLGVFLLAGSLIAAETVVPLVPFDGSAETFLNRQIAADTVANGGLQPDRVYELQRGAIYLANAVYTVPNGDWLKIRAAEGTGEKPVVYLYETGSGSSPTRPPGTFATLNGGSCELKNFCIAGYYEPEPDRIDGVQGGLFNTNAVGSTIIMDGMVFSNINGQHIRTGSNSVKVQVTNCIFANMGSLSTSNLGAGKGFDLREASCDSFIVVNNTFVNYQDRPIRHYNFKDPAAGTGLIQYGLVDHNTFVNGMSYHGLFSMGNVGPEITITNNLFVDAFALGEDSTDASRAAEWANTGEVYANGNNKITWIFSAPNDVTSWTVLNNYYAISDSGQDFLDDYGFPEGDKLSAHITGKIGGNAAFAFMKENLALDNIPGLMTNMMRWYETPAAEGGAGKAKDQTNYDRTVHDYDRRVIQFYRDTLDASYPEASAAYTGGEGGFPVGDLNWFPAKKAQWEQGVEPAAIVVDGQKDAFFDGLAGPDDGYLQLKSYAFNDNGTPPKGDADLSAKIWTAWDNTWLYVYQEVMDDTISSSSANTYNNDGIEIKIDPVPADSTVNTIVSLDLTAQYTEGVAGNTNFGTTIPESDKQYARRVFDGGYALEMAVKWSAIVSTTGSETVTPMVGGVFGLAFNVHDNDNMTGTRESSVQWAATLTDAVWNQPKYLGTVEFLPDNKLKYVPQNAVAARSNAVPYDGTPFYMRIDGKKDPFYTLLSGPDEGYLQLRYYHWSDNGEPRGGDKDLSAKIWTAWDDNWFYLYEEVKDDTVSSLGTTNVWEMDNLELKIDPQPTDSTVNSVWDTRMTALAKTGTIAGTDTMNAVPDSLKKWTRAKVTGGYVIELALNWAAIKSATGNETVSVGEGNVFGMALCQHDNDSHGRQASIEWAAELLDAVWNMPKYHGTVKFLADHKLEFDPTNAVTGRTNILPYDGSDFNREGSGVEERSTAPRAFALEQNYPNPFNPTTTISYAVPKASDVRLTVYDMMGREVAVLAEGRKSPGFYSVEFDGKNLASGIYFYRLKAGSTVLKQKMVMLK
ncbi:T9SS type A sorting domain-containing protein [bacterium]|nr:T9SS type A sorting domain-containing protein [bacterium]